MTQKSKVINKYASYKYSGIPWVGDIPQEWEVRRLRNIGKFSSSGIDKKIEEGQPLVRIINYTDVYGNANNILNEKEYMVVSADADRIKEHLVQEGDLIFTPSSETIEDIGISALVNVPLLNTTYSYHVLRFRPTIEIYKQYKKYLCNNHYVLNYFSSRATGTIRQTLGRKDFKECSVILPTLQDQKTIADYLDKKCGAIDKVIETEKEVIEKLKEYKQSLITETVTKGLDKSVPMKDSGIPWIGPIPQHWEIKRLKRIVSSFAKGKGITKDEVIEDGSIPCVRYGEIYSKYNNKFDSCFSMTEEKFIPTPQYFSYGNILFAGTGELIEEIGKNIVYVGQQRCLAGGDIIVMKHNENPVFLNYALSSSYSQAQKSYGKIKLKVVHISETDIGNILVALPTIKEQNLIADYLDDKCTKIDKAIVDKEQVIEKMTEYKKSLIYECVTGKRKVIK